MRRHWGDDQGTPSGTSRALVCPGHPCKRRRHLTVRVYVIASRPHSRGARLTVDCVQSQLLSCSVPHAFYSKMLTERTAFRGTSSSYLILFLFHSSLISILYPNTTTGNPNTQFVLFQRMFPESNNCLCTLLGKPVRAASVALTKDSLEPPLIV